MPMSIQIPSANHPRVTVSRYHDGQMVTPRIEAEWRDLDVWVEFAWSSSSGGIWDRDVFLGSVHAAQKWLENKGVRSPVIGGV